MTKGPCPLESRPRDGTLYAVERSTNNLRSPLDFVSGCGLVFTPFRVKPTRSLYRRALDRTPERGNETAHRPTAAERELVARSPHAKRSVERSILCRLPLAWETCKGGTPFARFFPPFLAGQEMENARPPLCGGSPRAEWSRRRYPGKTSTNSNLHNTPSSGDISNKSHFIN